MKKLLTLLTISCMLSAISIPLHAQYDTLKSFNSTNGKNPKGSLVLIGNELFGMTFNGGASVDGNVFSIKTNGSRDNPFYSFNGAHGQNPYGSLTYSGAGHTVYGMTYFGGAHAYGCVFSMDTNGGNYKDLWDFNAAGNNGQYPQGSLLLSGHKLYGTTTAGGTHSAGNVFSIDTNGGASYVDLYDFLPASGVDPTGSLILIGHQLYGMTFSGALNNAGNVFSLDTNGGNFKDRWDFNIIGNNGAHPEGSLTLMGHEVYGMTSAGGINHDGNIFSVDTNGGNYKDRWDFDGGGDTNGSVPYGDLVLSGKVLYGMTSAGGRNSDGNIFSIDTNGSQYQDRWDFNGTTGSVPSGNITLSGVVVYGMTGLGGPDNDGVIFKDTLISIRTTDTNISCNGSNNGHATVYVKGGVHPFTYSWTGGATTAKATGLSAGTYTITVTDNDGLTATASISISQPPVLAITIVSHANVPCNGGTGSILANAATGGTPTYTYNWSPSGGTALSANNLSAGTYTITATDKQGCTAMASATITQPATALTATSYMVQDDGTSDGVAAVTPSGGTPPYTYSWSPGGANTDTIKGLHARGYCCTISDSHNCTDTVCIVVSSDAGINNITSVSGQITIYPNPSNGTVTVMGIASMANDDIQVYNALGEEVYPSYKPGNYITVDFSNESNGVYFLRVISNKGYLVGEGKLILQK